MEQKYAFILSLLITILIATNLFIFSELKNTKIITMITKVIDGDTFIVENGRTIRLANINTPEKGSSGFEEAKAFLSQYKNQTIEIEVIGTEKYGRTLARIYTPEYLNLEIIKEGLANKFLVDKSELKVFSEAEAQAIENQKGIWKSSSFFGCVKIEVFPEEELVKIINSCPEINFQDWVLKDESRKKYKFHNLTFTKINIRSNEGKNNETDLFWQSKQNVWNDDRESAYMFDSENNLVDFYFYGY